MDALPSFILRNRLLLLVLLATLTGFMAHHARQVALSYEFQQITPKDDPDFQAYQDFKERFGKDDNTLVIGLRPQQEFFQLRLFQNWIRLADSLRQLDGVSGVFSIHDVRRLEKKPRQHRFEPVPVFPTVIQDQVQLDSLKEDFFDQRFYHDLIYNDATGATYMGVSIEKKVLSSDQRVALVAEIEDVGQQFERENRAKLHYSGLPYIRTRVSKKVENELRWFSALSVLVTSLLLLVFFRKPVNMIFPLIVIGIMIIWTLGSMHLLGYKITLLSSLIPPLIIIISIPNFIYFLNKFHQEFVKHGNKARAITRMIKKIGVVTLLTNLTTAIGFLVLATTESPILQEFGLVAGINIIATFVVTIIIFPVVFSYLPAPSTRHLLYLENRSMDKALDRLYHWIFNRRPIIYAISAGFVVLSIAGALRLEAVAYLLDDIPKDDILQQDLRFFERNFQGIMPFEITVDTKKEKGLYRLQNLKMIQELQDSMKATGKFSRPLSPVEVVSFMRQGFYNGNPDFYGLPGRRERSFLLPYLRNTTSDSIQGFDLADSSYSIARISASVKDLGSHRMKPLVQKLKTQSDSIFKGSNAEIHFTGISLIVLKNNQYLIESLLQSLLLAFILISMVMALLFGKIRMVLISLVPNFLPLLATAGLMGWAGIPLKPSTVLVFSIAFGISVDDALHFLAKYRQELFQHNWDISHTVSLSLRETGRSMIYTSLVLFCGFAIFYFSSFGGTAFLGLLTAITLLFAMVTNLVLLPALILEFDSARRGSIFFKRNRKAIQEARRLDRASRDDAPSTEDPSAYPNR